MHAAAEGAGLLQAIQCGQLVDPLLEWSGSVGGQRDRTETSRGGLAGQSLTKRRLQGGTATEVTDDAQGQIAANVGDLQEETIAVGDIRLGSCREAMASELQHETVRSLAHPRSKGLTEGQSDAGATGRLGEVDLDLC
ncbi:hypothetical protein CKO15_08950 [Halorhodospira abdelmalekii]|nr:hypothetical protein [Halorhodospira abdelmalekii]